MSCRETGLSAPFGAERDIMTKTGIVAAAAGLAVIASHASAQSITTLFSRNNGGSNGGAVYFDVTVGANPIQITGFDTNTAELVSFGWEVFTRDGGGIGQHLAMDWSSVATGSGQGMGIDIPSPVALNSFFTLSANTTYGLALVIGPEAGHDYSGTGSNPAPGMTNYSNGDVSLTLGEATNVPFAGSAFNPRIWNGTIYYRVIPAPASLALLGLGGLVAARRRR